MLNKSSFFSFEINVKNYVIMTNMVNKITKINNHFIPKAFAKNFSYFGILKYTDYERNSKEMKEQTYKVNEDFLLETFFCNPLLEMLSFLFKII